MKKKCGKHVYCYCALCQEYWCWNCHAVFTSAESRNMIGQKIKKIMHADGDCIPRFA